MLGTDLDVIVIKYFYDCLSSARGKAFILIDEDRSQRYIAAAIDIIIRIDPVS
jgi:hypothetical protein